GGARVGVWGGPVGRGRFGGLGAGGGIPRAPSRLRPCLRMGSISRVRRPGGRPAMAPPPPPWCHLANQHPREMPGNISFLSLRAVALQPLIENMLKMKALPLRVVHALDACAPRNEFSSLHLALLYLGSLLSSCCATRMMSSLR